MPLWNLGRVQGASVEPGESPRCLCRTWGDLAKMLHIGTPWPQSIFSGFPVLLGCSRTFWAWPHAFLAGSLPSMLVFLLGVFVLLSVLPPRCPLGFSRVRSSPRG